MASFFDLGAALTGTKGAKADAYVEGQAVGAKTQQALQDARLRRQKGDANAALLNIDYSNPDAVTSDLGQLLVAEAGGQFDNARAGLIKQQQYDLTGRVADPNTTADARFRAQQGLKPELTQYDFSDNRVGNKINGGVTVTDLGDSVIDENTAQAAAQNALAGKYSREATAPKADDSYVQLTPDETTALGLSPGTVAQRNKKDNKVEVVSKPAATTQLSAKEQVRAKEKLLSIGLAKQQLATVAKLRKELQDSAQSGFGQGWVPGELGKNFDAAVDSLRSTITAILKVPGVGSMSNYETGLDQSKLPGRGEYESSQDQKIQSLADTIDLLDTGYKELLGGDLNPPAPPGSPPAAPSGAPVRVTSAAEARKLPSGTVFITPDGRTLQVP